MSQVVVWNMSPACSAVEQEKNTNSYCVCGDAMDGAAGLLLRAYKKTTDDTMEK